MEASIIAHLENASPQRYESEIASNFKTVYAKQFLHQKLHLNFNEPVRPVQINCKDVHCIAIRCHGAYVNGMPQNMEISLK